MDGMTQQSVALVEAASAEMLDSIEQIRQDLGFFRIG